MAAYERMRDALRSGAVRYDHLDAAQLVKHAFGLVTQSAREGKPATLIYLYAEPAQLNGRAIASSVFEKHREEVGDFQKRVAGGVVTFETCRYRDWLSGWAMRDAEVALHARAVLERFNP